MLKEWRAKNPKNSTSHQVPIPFPKVVTETETESENRYDSAIMHAVTDIIVTRSSFLAKSAENGFISPHTVDYYLSCFESVETVKASIKKLPVNDPKNSQARSHLVEMSIGFESMVQSFEEGESNTNGKRYFRLPSRNKLQFALNAESVFEHYKRLELLLAP